MITIVIGCVRDLPSGKRLHSYGQSPFWMGKPTLSMAIFSIYVSHYQRVSQLKEMNIPIQFCILTDQVTWGCFLGKHHWVEWFGFMVYTISGWWWLEHAWIIFPYIGNSHPNWLIFVRRGWNHQPDIDDNWRIFHWNAYIHSLYHIRIFCWMISSISIIEKWSIPSSNLT